MTRPTLRSALLGAALPALLVSTLGSGRLLAQDPMADCPMHAQHMAQTGSGSPVDSRGDEVMGFGHERTRHHFLLAPEGGSIDVAVTDPADAASREAIRKHLAQVAQRFAEGDFAMPGAIHARTLPGIETMRQRKAEIDYRYEETPSGGRVRIVSANPEAREAIHAFLRAQIEDHRTGDSVEEPGER